MYTAKLWLEVDKCLMCSITHDINHKNKKNENLISFITYFMKTRNTWNQQVQFSVPTGVTNTEKNLLLQNKVI